MSAAKVKFIVIDNEDISKTLIESYTKEIGFPFEIVKYDEFDKEIIKNDDSPKFVFVDINLRNQHILNDIQNLSLNQSNVFILISSEPSTDLYVKSLRAGAKEFLRKPLVKEDFFKVVKNHYRNLQQEESSKNDDGCKIISVTSNEKGCGKTFFAINIARELAGLTKEKVLLLDFNDNINNVAFSLDLDPFLDTKDIIQNINETNTKSYLSKILNYKKSSLFIISDGLYKSRVDMLSLQNMIRFFEIMQKYFKYIVVDINQDMQYANDMIFSKSRTIFYMITSSLTSGEKNKKYISENVYNKKFKVLLNKYRAKDEAKSNEIELNLGKEIFHRIPMSLMITAGSANRGKTIREINPNTDIVQAYNRIAKYIINRV